MLQLFKCSVSVQQMMLHLHFCVFLSQCFNNSLICMYNSNRRGLLKTRIARTHPYRILIIWIRVWPRNLDFNLAPQPAHSEVILL